MSEIKYCYFYRTTNLINNKYYFGVHKTSNLNDGYLGSGLRLQYAIKKYGYDNFKNEILKFFDTYQEALDYEMEIVNEQLLLDPMCYNLACGGGRLTEGPHLRHKESGEIHHPKNYEEYKKMYDSGLYDSLMKGRIVVKDKNGKIFSVLATDERYLNGELLYHTLGTVVVKDKNNNFFRVDCNDPRYLSGELTCTWKGRHCSEDTKKKIKLKLLSQNHQKGETNSQYGTMFIHNLELAKNKRIKKEDLNIWINLGWIKGAKFTTRNNRKQENHPRWGTCWIYNDIEQRSIQVKKEELQRWIDTGWKKGRRIKFLNGSVA